MSIAPSPIEKEIRRLSRADRKKHEGVQYTRRRIANAVQDALKKLVIAGIASPFEYDVCDRALTDANDLQELMTVRDKFLEVLKVTADAGKPVEAIIGHEGIQRIFNPVTEDAPQTSTTTTTISTPTTETPTGGTTIETPTSERQPQFELPFGAVRIRSNVPRQLFADKPTVQPTVQNPSKRQIEDEPMEEAQDVVQEETVQPKKKKRAVINIDEELSFLDEEDTGQKSLKRKLRDILKEPERVDYYRKLCPHCGQRSKVFGDDLCSPCKRAETSRGLSEMRRQQRAKERAVKMKENELLQRAIIAKQTRNLEKKAEELELALAAFT